VKSEAVSYQQAPGSPIYQIREAFVRSTREPATSSGLKVADELIAVLATCDPEDARRLIKLVRDLLDTLEPEIERRV
jgi:hypothetical protein